MAADAGSTTSPAPGQWPSTSLAWAGRSSKNAKATLRLLSRERLRLGAAVDGDRSDRRERPARELSDAPVEARVVVAGGRRSRDLHICLSHRRVVQPLAQAALPDRVHVDRDRRDEHRREQDDEERRREDEAVGERSFQDHAQGTRYDEIAVLWFAARARLSEGEVRTRRRLAGAAERVNERERGGHGSDVGRAGPALEVEPRPPAEPGRLRLRLCRQRTEREERLRPRRA